MPSDPTLIVGIGTGFGVLVLMGAINRRRISALEAIIFGANDGERPGMADEKDDIVEHIEQLDEKLDENERAHRNRHREVRQEVITNRAYSHDSFENLAELISEADDISDLDIDNEDIKPDWADINVAEMRRQRQRVYEMNDD